MHLLVEVRQVVLTRPGYDLRRAAARTAVAVAIAAIAILKEPLVLPLQLAIKLHPDDARVSIM
jgi:hypothetical protein